MKYILLSICIIQGIYLIYLYIDMSAEAVPRKLSSTIFPGWWMNSENLTQRGKNIRNKYIINIFISITLVILTFIGFL